MNVAWLKPLINRTRHTLAKNAPHILMGLGTAGGISAVIFAVKATPKAHEVLVKAADEKPEKLTVWDKIKAAGPIYIPAAGMELFSLICFWGAHGIDVKRQAILASVASTAETALQEYQRKVVEMIGDKGEREVRNAIAQDKVDKNPPPAMAFLPGDLEYWCMFEDQYFRSCWYKIKDAQNDANEEMIQNMYLSKAELMWFLDPERKYLKPDSVDGQIGWNLDRLIHLDIKPTVGENHQPVLVVTVEDKNGLEYPPQAGFCMLK